MALSHPDHRTWRARRSPVPRLPLGAFRPPGTWPATAEIARIRGKTRHRARALPKCEHRQDWMAVRAVSSEPVSPRFSPRTSWANKSRIRDGSRPVSEYPASNSHDGRAPRVVMGTRRDPAPFLGVRGVCAHVRAHVASASSSASDDDPDGLIGRPRASRIPGSSRIIPEYPGLKLGSCLAGRHRPRSAGTMIDIRPATVQKVDPRNQVGKATPSDGVLRPARPRWPDLDECAAVPHT